MDIKITAPKKDHEACLFPSTTQDVLSFLRFSTARADLLKILERKQLWGIWSGQKNRDHHMSGFLSSVSSPPFPPPKGIVITYLPSSKNMIPNWSAPKINVKICEASFHTHQTVPAKHTSGGGRMHRDQNWIWKTPAYLFIFTCLHRQKTLVLKNTQFFH